MAQLYGDIAKVVSVAGQKHYRPVIRLNGTSDIDFTQITILGKTIFEHFPQVKFVDYSKVARRLFANTHSNYHLTFSLSESNEAVAKTVAAAGHNVAVVFKSLPKTFWDKRVIDGDKHDLRFLDKKGVIVGLKAKGKARRNTSGFVK